MPQTIQASFNSGEWAPSLNARVDLAKYRSGAALLENFFVDYRGGASSRPGTQYILQCYKSATDVRIIPFQASTDVGYILEFGDGYVRFFFDGAPILEDPINISAATQANPCVITAVGNTYLNDNWVYVTGVGGMTQLNNKYYNAGLVAGNNISLENLNGVNINSTGYGAYTSGGTVRRVYTISSPYSSADLANLKFAQDVSQMVITHPDHPPYVLTLIEADNWTLLPITFGTTAQTPVPTSVTSSMGGGVVNYSYIVTSIDSNGQESAPSAPAVMVNSEDIRTTPGSIVVQWNAATGAVAYNVYRADPSYLTPVPTGATHGYVGTTTNTIFIDSNIAPDFSQTPPIVRNPFQGAGIDTITVTTSGTYTTVPSATPVGASDIAASLTVILGVQGTPTVAAGGAGYAIGDLVQFSNNVVLVVANVAAGAVTAWQPITYTGSNRGQVSGTGNTTPGNPVIQVSTSGGGTGATANLTWGVQEVLILNPGAGYVGIPTITFSAGAAAATATLASTSNGNPTCCGFYQQRLALGGARGAPQTIHYSQPGAYFNFNISSPVQADNAITATLASGQLNTIKAMVPMTTGHVLLTDRANWLINGGSPGSVITPSALAANPQAYVGTNDVPPIVANFDILFQQAKGSAVRDANYNIYVNSFTGTDITAQSSHLFYGYNIHEWAWAEEPYKVVWAVRNDGVMLTLTFLKEQDFIGWAHSVTNGSFKSVAAITEVAQYEGQRDAVYTVVERTINGNTVKYIERIAERIYPNGRTDAWCVDAGLQYDGAPATSFSGGEHLAGAVVTGLADGVVITPFTMPTNGNFTLPVAASKVTVGLAFTAKLQTLAIDLGEPTVQGKLKKIANIDLRVAQTLGIKIGPNFSQLQTLKDTVVGNVSSMLTGQPRGSQVVTDLVTSDARGFPASSYTPFGQICVQQDLPYPATILGVIPDVQVGG